MGGRPERPSIPSSHVILIDSSAWIEFLRNTSSPVCNEVDRLIGKTIATCDAIVMEVTAGAKSESHLKDLRGLLARATLLPTESMDYERAATLHRTCRSNGDTVRTLVDCLIAAVAIRHNVPILHSDTDFSTIARHSPLRIHAPTRLY